MTDQPPIQGPVQPKAAPVDASQPSVADTAPISARGPPQGIPIVALGASAGGLEAVSRLLVALPPSTGMAFLLVQHLDPDHPSMMVDLLAKHTTMKVAEATEGCLLCPDQLHVIPPGRYLSLQGGALHVSAPKVHHGARLPFDVLLQSLAEEAPARSIAVVLSGTGSDGTKGIAALKAAGGAIIVQTPDDAEYDGMPQNAAATGLADRIAPLAKIPQALAELVEQIDHSADIVQGVNAAADLSKIITLLKDRTPHDFRQYKTGTIERRIDRRVAMLGMRAGDLGAYFELLQGDAAECDLLAKDLLINVTSFFRDPKVFEILTGTILPEIIAGLSSQQPLRIWVAGCSTGEEAYSLAIVCHEAIETAGRDIKLHVFASDVDPDAIATAREGLYSSDVASAITPERLARYFIKDEFGWRVSPLLRNDVVFTVQDLMSDPPFSRIDLVSCRNVLIYLNQEAQAKVIAMFHFALRERGVLVLGSSETIGSAEHRFEVIAKAERCYRHVARGKNVEGSFPFTFGEALPSLATDDKSSLPARQTGLAEICRRAVIDAHAPAAILINRKRQCLYSMGPTERYLRIAPGYATLDLLAMATPALRTRLRQAIDKAGKAVPRVDGGRARLTRDGQTFWFRMDVRWVGGEDEDLLLVCFLEEPATLSRAASASSRGDGSRIAELESELEALQVELQFAIQHQEASSQEQKAINEEALSVNEEFQSTNEELLTSKEELQSLNEELTALNSQLQETLERQRLTSDDLQNVLYSTNVATLFLDKDLCIRFFTPAIKSLFSVLSTDIGRPLADLRPVVDDPELLADARRVLANEDAIDRQISAEDGVWFSRRIFPYRAHDSHVEGVVITFADVTERKQTARALEEAKLAAEQANLAKSRFLAAASHDLRQPLQSLTLIQELLTQSATGEKSQKLVARLGQTIGAMSGMLNALLDINQIDAGVVKTSPSAFPINDILDRLRDEFSYMAQTRSLSLRVMPSGAMAMTDPRLLEQILRNLLGNAVKYTRRGKILLGCRRRGNTVKIEIHDTGIGIAANELSAIFEEFHQIDNPARERSQGLGLGLTIVQRLAKLLGHDIDVKSVPGVGSCFSITINIAQPAVGEPAEPAALPASINSAAAHACSVFVVEDDPDLRDLLAQLLSAEGHFVTTACDADAALKMIGGGAIRPDILLTDYNLPGQINGLELISRLRDHLPEALPALILTGDISSETLGKIDLQSCLQLSKPVKGHELSAAIERLCTCVRPPLTPVLPSLPGDLKPRFRSITYIVDDDDDVRATLRDVLESDGHAVEDFASAEEFLASYSTGSEGCLLVDAHLPGMNGIKLLEELRKSGDHLPTILITGSSDVGLAVQAMRTGACDFIEKPVGRAELLASIARAIDQSHDLRVSDAIHEQAAALVASLTKRQHVVMNMVLAGNPSKIIAHRLGISQRTVDNHRAAIMQKMGAKSLPQLARLAQNAAHDHLAGLPSVPAVGEGSD